MSKNEEKYTNAEIADIVDSEGLGYAIQSYCSGEDFEDQTLAVYWDEAKELLDKIEEYLSQYASEGGYLYDLVDRDEEDEEEISF